MIDVLIVNFNTGHLLPRMLEACEKARGHMSLRYLIIDNASTDNSIPILNNLSIHDALIENELNVGFGRANNQLRDWLQHNFVLLLNTDAFIQADSLSKSISFMESHPECGILGLRLIGEEGRVQPSCRYFPTPLNVFLSRTGLSRFFPGIRTVDQPDWAPKSAQECDWVPGCFFLIRAEVIKDIGFFDPIFFLYYEEVDLCLRAKSAGWKVMYSPDSTVIHLGGESAKTDGTLSASGRQLPLLQIESELLFFRKHYGGLGLIRHIILTCIGDIILAIKDIARGRGLVNAFAQLMNTKKTVAILWATRFATCSTR